jgi:hypothetical protein
MQDADARLRQYNTVQNLSTVPRTYNLGMGRVTITQTNRSPLVHILTWLFFFVGLFRLSFVR